jgi:hypothetical protein
MQHLSKEKFDILMKSRADGKTVLSIPKQVARRFFTRVGNDSVKDTIGMSVNIQKLVILAGVLASPLIFGIFAISIYLHMGAAYASIVVPLAGICWTVVYGLTSHWGGWLVGTIPLMAALALLMAGSGLGEPLFLFVLSIWLQRSTYLLAGKWLEHIVSSSYEAYEMLVEHITISTDD